MKKQKSTISFLFGENRLVFQHGPEGAFNRHDDSHLGGKGQKWNPAKSNKQELAETGLEAGPLKPAEVGKDKPISYEEASKTTIAAGIENLKKMHEASESDADKALAYTHKFLDRVGIKKDALQKLIPEAQTDLQFYNGIRNLQTAIGINPDGKIGEKTLTAIRDYHGQDLKILAAIAQFRTEAGTSFKKAIAKAKKTGKPKPTPEQISNKEFATNLGLTPEKRYTKAKAESRQEQTASLPQNAMESRDEREFNELSKELSSEYKKMLKYAYGFIKRNPGSRQSFTYTLGGEVRNINIIPDPLNNRYVISDGSLTLFYTVDFLERIFRS